MSIGNKVLNFPINKTKENIDRVKKLNEAYSLIKQLASVGYDFHIVVTKQAASELFKLPSDCYNYAILTSNIEEAEEYDSETLLYELKGDKK